MGLKTLIGYVLSGLAVLLIAGGTVGYTVEGQIDEVPTPNIEGYVFFPMRHCLGIQHRSSSQQTPL